MGLSIWQNFRLEVRSVTLFFEKLAWYSVSRRENAWSGLNPEWREGEFVMKFFNVIVFGVFFFTPAIFCRPVTKLATAALVERHVSFLVEQRVEKKNSSFYFVFSGFKCREVEFCRLAIHDKGSLDPLMWTWRKHRDTILNDTFALREFTVLLVMVYQNLILHVDGRRDIPWFGLISLYMKLNAIPLQKLFDVLEECLVRYQIIFEDYSNGSLFHDSLIEWFQENWWLPTAIFTMATVSFLRWLRGRHAPSIFDISGWGR